MMSVPVTWRNGEPDFGVPQTLFAARNIVTSNFGYDVTGDGQKFLAVVEGAMKPSPITVRIGGR